jgi:hypothetical protein
MLRRSFFCCLNDIVKKKPVVSGPAKRVVLKVADRNIVQVLGERREIAPFAGDNLISSRGR